MQAIVHFTVGVFMALLALTVLDLPVRREFLLLFLSGFWAMIPDGYWLLRELGIVGPETVWRALHRSAWANVFWFHNVIDGLETGRNNLEASVSLAVLLVLVFGYYRYNDWTVD
jgi:hypothetical protein